MAGPERCRVSGMGPVGAPGEPCASCLALPAPRAAPADAPRRAELARSLLMETAPEPASGEPTRFVFLSAE